MKATVSAAAAGAAGAMTTNVLHELTRHSLPGAPRVDLLGMQALTRACCAAGAPLLRGRTLYRTTLAADLVSNSAYFAGVAASPTPVLAGLLLGLAAGAGAVFLPGPMGLSTSPTARTAATAVFTTLLYTAGGLAAGLLYDRLRD